MRKYLIYFLIFASIFRYIPVLAATPNNSGFIPGQIWYSKDTLVEGETVYIHTAVWNSENKPLIAKVEFYDKNVILGSRDVPVAPLELKDVSIPWKITSGDHLLSAKIISSNIVVGGTKEKVVLSRITTSSDKQFVSVVVKNDQGVPVSGVDLLKNQVDKTTSEINSIIPPKVSSTVSGGLSVVDNLRAKTFSSVDNIKNETEKQINADKSKVVISSKSPQKSSTLDAVKTPIAYLKLFFFSILAFIFGNKIVFYGLLVLLIFIILRFVYRRIRNS